MSSSTIGFAHWQLYWAVVALATSELSRRDRLVEAVASRVNRIFPLLDHPGDLPPDIWQRTAALHERLTAGGSYRATVDAMADAEVELTIRQLIELRGMLARVSSDGGATTVSHEA